ncbi:MAG: L,D-transpeptidase family protein [Phycisphaerae bacterium]|nr:L,D-transpeptidase family protein [Phycisphaerae bacterium]
MARYHPVSNRKGNWLLWILLAFVVGAGGYFILSKNNGQPQITESSEQPAVDNTALVEESAAIPETEPEPIVSGGEIVTEVTESSALTEGELSEAGYSDAAKSIAASMACLDASPPKIIEARIGLNDLLPMEMNSAQRDFVKAQLSMLADKWLFSKTIFPQDPLCGTHKVTSGQLLSKIGKMYSVPYEILMQINGISKPESLQAGQTIKVINGPFHARIYKSRFQLDLYLQNTFVKSFPVGLGKPGYETPTGLWVVEVGGKMIKPSWTDPDTGKTYDAEDLDYPLGERWIALEGIKGDAVGRDGFAIHGTNKADEIGAAKSRGCIRMYNDDVILMYNLLESGLSKVEIVD